MRRGETLVPKLDVSSPFSPTGQAGRSKDYNISISSRGEIGCAGSKVQSQTCNKTRDGPRWNLYFDSSRKDPVFSAQQIVTFLNVSNKKYATLYKHNIFSIANIYVYLFLFYNVRFKFEVTSRFFCELCFFSSHRLACCAAIQSSLEIRHRHCISERSCTPLVILLSPIDLDLRK